MSTTAPPGPTTAERPSTTAPCSADATTPSSTDNAGRSPSTTADPSPEEPTAPPPRSDAGHTPTPEHPDRARVDPRRPSRPADRRSESTGRRERVVESARYPGSQVRQRPVAPAAPRSGPPAPSLTIRR